MASRSSSSQGSKDESMGLSDADLAQAFRDLQKGETTAQALEANLTHLEKKIDDLLASFEESERSKVENANASQSKPSNSESNERGTKEA